MAKIAEKRLKWYRHARRRAHNGKNTCQIEIERKAPGGTTCAIEIWKVLVKAGGHNGE